MEEEEGEEEEEKKKALVRDSKRRDTDGAVLHNGERGATDGWASEVGG